jgi:hypothetical protein
MVIGPPYLRSPQSRPSSTMLAVIAVGARPSASNPFPVKLPGALKAQSVSVTSQEKELSMTRPLMSNREDYETSMSKFPRVENSSMSTVAVSVLASTKTVERTATPVPGGFPVG